MERSKPDWVTLALIERAAFGVLLRGLTPEQLAMPSLCKGWSVHDVARHVAATNSQSVGSEIGAVILSGFRRSVATHRLAEEWKRRSDRDLLETVVSADLRGFQGIFPVRALAEAFLHQQDIRRPLGIPRPYDSRVLTALLEVTPRQRLGTGAPRRVRGVRLVATDLGITVGDGPELTGTAEALLMAAHGRLSALSDCEGPGRTVIARQHH